MDIIKLGLDELKPYEKNAKRHTDEQIQHIINSIEQFGMNDPIGIWGEKNVIVEGHGRYFALKKMGVKEVDCIRLDHLSDEERKAYTLVHNQATLETPFDDDLLKIELDGIFDIDMSEFGFELNLDDDEPQEVVEDEVPEEVETRCKLGDIWQLGEHFLICGDSTDPAVIDRLMDGVKADMVFTDPPYGMNLDTDYSKMNGNEGHGKKYDKGFVDDFHSEMIDAIMLMNAKETFIWGADYFAELIPNRNSGSWFVWDKRENELTGANVDKRFGSMFELCWSKEKHKREIFRFMWAGMMKQKDVDDKRYHPTQKPIKLAGWFLDRYSKEGQVIVDLFGGSGSTLIACEQLNRKCYMAELDPHYCDVIISRYENFTGKAAVKVS